MFLYLFSLLRTLYILQWPPKTMEALDAGITFHDKLVAWYLTEFYIEFIVGISLFIRFTHKV